MQFRRRPDTLFPFEANQYKGPGHPLPLGAQVDSEGYVYVTTVQGRDVRVSAGEWVIQEPDLVHYYPCQDEIFRARYEEVPDGQSDD